MIHLEIKVREKENVLTTFTSSLPCSVLRISRQARVSSSYLRDEGVTLSTITHSTDDIDSISSIVLGDAPPVQKENPSQHADAPV